MSPSEFTVTNLELRQSTETGEAGAGLEHKSEGLFLLHVLETAGQGEPRGTVVFVHDAGDHGGRYRAVAKVLAERNWAVALPDLRGNGRSEGDRGHNLGMREVYRDIEEVQNHLAYRVMVGPKILVGVGLGALYALGFALDQPGNVDALILVAPLFDPRFVAPPAPSGLKKLFQKLGPRSAGSIGWTPDQLSEASDVRDARNADDLVHDVCTLRTQEVAKGLAETVSTQAGDLAQPMLVLTGDDDALAPASSGRLQKAEHRSFPGRKHELLQGNGGDEVAAAIAEFLESSFPA